MKPKFNSLVFAAVFVFSHETLIGGQLSDLRADIDYTKDRIERKEAAIARIKESIDKMSGDYEERAGELAKMEEVTQAAKDAGSRAKDLEYSIRKKLAVLNFYDSNAGKGRCYDRF